MCDFVPNIPTVYNGSLPFFKCLKILNCIFYSITAFKVEKNTLKKIKKLSEVAIGGGGLKTSDTVLSFMLFLFNLSLRHSMSATSNFPSKLRLSAHLDNIYDVLFCSFYIAVIT